MKPTFILVCIFLIGLLAGGCTKKENTSELTNADSMTISKSGMVGMSFYKIAGGQLKQDTTFETFNEPMDYNVVLSADKYEAMNTAMQRIPMKLLDNDGAQYIKGRFEDCTIYHMVAWKNGSVYKWSISECAEGAPKYVNDFADEIGRAVSIAEE